ncbi:uncharacterized protein B0J16DRAFT_342023 [Fusarium flagelliforme]|uniref:uncharacterized protein n=1 Tax=Fusarium flagelliforme TaxID=2675880 RepID=UPI001E8D4C3E|nr:uncharacterized protein B0J16DRAFT_342023 [Fusarium flagelliforme]KAH7185567.1 hypothetical protein B0J16DRAFT_342023 [Fusarium flagelliforme]
MDPFLVHFTGRGVFFLLSFLLLFLFPISPTHSFQCEWGHTGIVNKFPAKFICVVASLPSFGVLVILVILVGVCTADDQLIIRGPFLCILRR